MSAPTRRVPRISGKALSALALAVRAGGAAASRAMFRRDLRIDQLERLPESYRGPLQLDNSPLAGRAPRAPHDEGLGPPEGGTWATSCTQLQRAFAAGTASPLEVARRAFAEAAQLASQQPSLGPLLLADEGRALRDAEASLDRHRRGEALGPLDGVPVVIKEETAIAGLPLRMGTACLPSVPEPHDATVVARLRAAGAIILGHSPMTEYGLSPLGSNPHRRMPRNPHDVSRLAGGSSTGSGVAVASGLVPLALGADGGGSIRIPASLCGVFGLKPTWGRVSRAGDGFGGTMNHVGPLGSSSIDLAAFLDVAAGADAADPQTLLAPGFAAGSFSRALGRGVRGLRIGVLEHELEAATPQVAVACREALTALERDGATLVPLRIELARFAAPIGYVTIAVESFAELRAMRLERDAELGDDLRIRLATIGALSVEDVSDAMRLRMGLRLAIAAALRDVDALCLPTTAITAPEVTDDEARSGFVDPWALDGVCRFAFLANLTGLPAATAPVGVDADRLPIGLQLVGDAHDEATLLALLAHLERIGAARAPRPRVCVNLL